MNNIDKWDIVEADVPFREDLTKSKLRPVLIISENEYLVLKLTTHHHSDKPRPYEYEISKWQEAGLTAMTYIQCDRFVRLSQKRLTGKRYGRLQMADIIGVTVMMRFHGLIT